MSPGVIQVGKGFSVGLKRRGGGAYKRYEKMFRNEQITNKLRLTYRADPNTFFIYLRLYTLLRHNKSGI